MTDLINNATTEGELIEYLATGFEALLDKVDALLSSNAELGKQIRELQTPKESKLNTYDPSERSFQPDVKASGFLHSSSREAQPLVGEDKDGARNLSSRQTKVLRIQDGQDVWWSQIPEIAKGFEAWQMLRTRNGRLVADTENSLSKAVRPIGLADGPSRTRRSSSLPTEQDFTTSGPKGDLSCPFAAVVKLRKQRRTTETSDSQERQRPDPLPTPPDLKEQLALDPIAAEFHAADFASPPPSVSGSASKCPIRFLDQHSPEEVAKYFENHKHEIPRSHEICVKRYQTNEASIRQLDAKYGNLVSMIQGLGLKHQPMLPSKEEEEAAMIDRQSIEKVEQWAEKCSANAHVPIEVAEATSAAGDTRSGHFERSLKDVRVGESPSRPWGISVPYTSGLGLSSNPGGESVTTPDHSKPAHTDNAQTSSPRPENPPRAGRCPFGFDAVEAVPTTERKASVNPDKDSNNVETSNLPNSDDNGTFKRPQMVFNGPVFVGYSPEQASMLLRSYDRRPND